MTQADLSAEWFAKMASVDTPTICNALELARGERSVLGYTRGTPVAAPRPLPAFVGYARTLRYSAAAPGGLAPAEARAMRLAYYRYIEPKGTPVVVVMQDIDDTPGLGSFWGEVNSNIHQALGVRGVLTNGSVRDLDVLAPGLPIIAGSVGPSHGFSNVVDFDKPVTVFGLAVKPGDLIHADRHGAAIIPPELADRMPHCIDVCVAREKPVLDATRKPGFSVADIEKAFGEADDIH